MNKEVKTNERYVYVLTFLLVASLFANFVLYENYRDKKESYSNLKEMYDKLSDQYISR